MGKELTAEEKDKKERLEIANREAQTQGALVAFNSSEAGKILRSSFQVELAGAITDIANNAIKYTHADFIAKALYIEERLNFLQALGVAKDKFALAQETIKDLTDSPNADTEQ